MGQLLSPLTQTPYPDATDNAVGDLLEVPDAVLNLEKYANLRYTSAAARDAAVPVPVRGMRATVGTTTANSYPCWYDGGTWRGMMAEQFVQDAGFPVAATSAVADVVLSRITVAARDYARVVSAVGATTISYTQANTMGLVVYAGASVFGRSQRNVTASVTESFTVVSNSSALAAGASVVLELRASRIAGTGAYTTSTSGALTTFSATVTPA